MIKKILTEDDNNVTLANKTIADAVDKADNILGDDTVYSGQGVIEDTLDTLLRINRRQQKYGGRSFQNALFIGGAGTGKTSRITAWARKNNINLVKVLASTMDDTDLGGVIAANTKDGVAAKLASTQFDELETVPNSVLFLDEWNRAPTTVRGTLLTLIQDHEIPDPRVKGGARYLPNFLFTIAAINPSDADYNVDELDAAELGRVMVVNVPADPKNLLGYLRNTLTKNMKLAQEYKDQEAYNTFAGQLAIAEKLLLDPRFSMDDEDDIEQVKSAKYDHRGNGLYLNNRSFTNCLETSEGKKDKFIDNWNKHCNSLKKQTIEEILKDYKDVDDKANSVFDSASESSVFNSKQAKIQSMKDRLKIK